MPNNSVGSTSFDLAKNGRTSNPGDKTAYSIKSKGIDPRQTEKIGDKYFNSFNKETSSSSSRINLHRNLFIRSKQLLQAFLNLG